MSRRRTAIEPPRAYVTTGGAWPNGPFRDDAPLPAIEVAHLVQLLEAALDGKTASRVAQEAGVSRDTIRRITNGEVWPEFLTVSRLAEVLGTDLWPHRVSA